jgi:hypothetical protein
MEIERGSVGVVTVTDTAVEAKAGASPLNRRHTLIVSNKDTAKSIYYGYAATVTDATGMPIAPGGMMAFDFAPHQYVPVYLVAATGESLSAAVEECA